MENQNQNEYGLLPESKELFAQFQPMLEEETKACRAHQEYQNQLTMAESELNVARGEENFLAITELTAKVGTLKMLVDDCCDNLHAIKEKYGKGENRGTVLGMLADIRRDITVTENERVQHHFDRIEELKAEIKEIEAELYKKQSAVNSDLAEQVNKLRVFSGKSEYFDTKISPYHNRINFYIKEKTKKK